jgi:hypothetical protein
MEKQLTLEEIKRIKKQKEKVAAQQIIIKK